MIGLMAVVLGQRGIQWTSSNPHQVLYACKLNTGLQLLETNEERVSLMISVLW